MVDPIGEKNLSWQEPCYCLRKVVEIIHVEGDCVQNYEVPQSMNSSHV